MREFGRGARMLAAGFGWWRRSAGVMALGLLPGVVVALLVLASLIALGAQLGPITDVVTPFADPWPEAGRAALRLLLATAIVGGVLVVVVVSFTAVTLVIGEPFYDRIWRSVERTTTGAVPDEGYPFIATVADSVRLVAGGVLIALLGFGLGLIPVIDTITGAVVGFCLTALLVADELSSRALTARGLDRRRRRALQRRHRLRMLGFGAATQLCFLVPLGAIAVMPAAVAGSILLAQSLLEEAAVATPAVDEAAPRL